MPEARRLVDLQPEGAWMQPVPLKVAPHSTALLVRLPEKIHSGQALCPPPGGPFFDLGMLCMLRTLCGTLGK